VWVAKPSRAFVELHGSIWRWAHYVWLDAIQATHAAETNIFISG